MEWAWRLRKTEASWDSSAVFWTGDHEKLGQNHGGGNGKKGTQVKTIEEVVLEGLGDTEYGAVMGGSSGFWLESWGCGGSRR